MGNVVERLQKENVMERLQIKAIKKAGRELTKGFAMAPKVIPQKHKNVVRKTTQQWLKEANV